jgi:hypothetical protein
MYALDKTKLINSFYKTMRAEYNGTGKASLRLNINNQINHIKISVIAIDTVSQVYVVTNISGEEQTIGVVGRTTEGATNGIVPFNMFFNSARKFQGHYSFDIYNFNGTPNTSNSDLIFQIEFNEHPLLPI